MNWYIVQAYSGFENKVADTFKDIMSKNSLENNLGEILVPTQKVVEVKKGKRTQKEKKYFPGYVLVKLDLKKILKLDPVIKRKLLPKLQDQTPLGLLLLCLF